MSSSTWTRRLGMTAIATVAVTASHRTSPMAIRTEIEMYPVSRYIAA